MVFLIFCIIRVLKHLPAGKESRWVSRPAEKEQRNGEKGEEMEHQLFCMEGLPASGKSTTAGYVEEILRGLRKK